MLWRRQLRCSFCQKKEQDIRKLVGGPGVYICDECIAAAKKIIDDTSVDDARPPKSTGLTKTPLLV